MSGAARFGRAPCTRPAATQKTNAVFTGLITPPESPIRFIPQVTSSGASGRASETIAPEAARETYTAAEVRMLLETLSPSVHEPTTTPTSSPLLSSAVFSGEYSYRPSLKPTEPDYNRVEPTFQSRGSNQSTLVDINNLSEEIYSIIEHAVEQKMADAMGPLRLNINRFESTFDNLKSHFHRENTDQRDQNDTMSRQLDLHYRTIEQHTEVFNSHVKAMNGMSEAQSNIIQAQSKNIQATTDSLATAASMVGQLSQVVTNLPIAINQAVQSAIQQQTQIAMQEILGAQRQAMLSIQGVPQARESVSSDGSSITMPPLYCQHGLEIESVSSMQDSQLHRRASQSSSTKSKSGFRYTLGKLFKCSRREQ